MGIRAQAAQRGFTLGELLITVVVAAVLAAAALPSYRTIMRNARLTTQSYDFVSALSLARSEAVKRGVPVTVCASADQAACGGTTGCNWENGWIVFVDSNNNHTVDVGDEILRATPALAAGYTLCATSGTSLTTYVTLSPKGAASATGMFVLCENSQVSPSRVVFVSTAGRISPTAQDSNSTALGPEGVTPITSCTPS